MIKFKCRSVIILVEANRLDYRFISRPLHAKKKLQYDLQRCVCLIFFLLLFRVGTLSVFVHAS